MGSMSDAFSETATYAVGDYCIYQDVLYKFIAAKSDGAWDVNAVSKTTIDAELKSLLNQINTLSSGQDELNSKIQGYLYMYRADTSMPLTGLKITMASRSRLVLFVWGQKNNEAAPFGLLIGISPSLSPAISYKNLTDIEIVPSWEEATLSVKIPLNSYTDVIINSTALVDISPYS